MTSNATHLAVFVHLCPHVFRHTGHHFCIGIRHQINQMAGTDLNTLLTGLTSFSVDDCNAVYHMNGIKRTNPLAAPAAKAAIGAGFCAASRRLFDQSAIICPKIFVLAAGFLTVSVAMHVSDLFHRAACFHSHDGCNGISYRSSADRTLIHRGLSLGNRCRQSRAAGITAASTVVSGQCFQNLRFFFIHIHMQLDVGNSQHETDDDTDNCNNQRGQ